MSEGNAAVGPVTALDDWIDSLERILLDGVGGANTLL